jgi:hypothetical protein
MRERRDPRRERGGTLRRLAQKARKRKFELRHFFLARLKSCPDEGAMTDGWRSRRKEGLRETAAQAEVGRRAFFYGGAEAPPFGSALFEGTCPCEAPLLEGTSACGTLRRLARKARKRKFEPRHFFWHD